MTSLSSRSSARRRALAALSPLAAASFAAASIAPAPVRAQPAPQAAASAPPVVLESVTVKGQALPGARSPYSSTLLDAERIRELTVHQPQELLRQVPGVEVRGYHLGGVVDVITIRGFNSGAHGGDLGMVLDGIPLNESMSHADGYADLNVVVPLEIETFQVYRGPVSALYGNFNRGGVIAINTRRGGDYAQLDASLGSFRTYDLQGAYGAKLGPGRFNAAVQLDSTKGYRPDSRFDRGTLAGRYTFDVTPRAALSLSGRAHKGSWSSASYLPLAQFEGGDPYGKDPRERGDGGSKEFYTARADFNYLLASDLKLLTFAYGTRQNYTRFFSRPLDATTYSQREETYRRRVSGLGFSLNGDRRFAGDVRLSYVVGAEHYSESTDYLFFDGTQNRARVGAAGYDRTFTFNSDSLFGEGELVVFPWLRPTLGVRHDRFSGDCTRNGSETGGDPCSALNTTRRTTPKVGVRGTVLPGVDLRTSYAEGFALPPGVAKYAPGGVGLEPTVFKQTEIGAKATWGIFSTDLAAYRLTSTNEVRTVSPGVYQNFGRTRRSGFEAQASVTPLDALELALVYNRVNASVIENANPALVGKWLTGVPRNTANVRIAWLPETGFGALAELHKVGNSAADAANTFFYGRYTTLDLGAQYVGVVDKRRYRVYLRVDNATDKVYASNAFIIGGQRLVAPGAPRSFKLGVQVDL